MIGHYLLTLSEEQEDRVLGERLGPATWLVGDGCRCLVGVVADVRENAVGKMERHDSAGGLNTSRAGGSGSVCIVGIRFDDLCYRFGAPRVNNAIRNRILSNRARRVLQNIPVGVGEDRPAL